MPHALTIASAAAVFAITFGAGSAAHACYKHTFDKCSGAMQVTEATASQGTEPSKPRLSSTASQGSGWVTTVTVNR